MWLLPSILTHSGCAPWMIPILSNTVRERGCGKREAVEHTEVVEGEGAGKDAPLFKSFLSLAPSLCLCSDLLQPHTVQWIIIRMIIINSIWRSELIVQLFLLVVATIHGLIP